MPINYTVSGNVVHAIATGVLTVEEIRIYQDQLLSDDKVPKGFTELFDVSQISESQIEQKDFRRIAEDSLKHPKRTSYSKLAIVAGKTSSFYNARLYEKEVEGTHNVIVFNDIHTAKLWLGLENDY